MGTEEKTDNWVAKILAKAVKDVALALENDPPTLMPQNMEMEVKAIHNDNIKITVQIYLEKID